MYAAASSPMVALSRGSGTWSSFRTCRHGGSPGLRFREFKPLVPFHDSVPARNLRHGAQSSSVADSGERKDFGTHGQNDSSCLLSGESGWMRRIADTKLGRAVAPVVASTAFYLQVSGSALAEVSEENWWDSDEGIITFVLTSGFLAILYLFVIPAITYNYLRLRWYRRNAAETYFQFMLVFLFFPGMLLLAPFINFRRLPKEGTEPP